MAYTEEDWVEIANFPVCPVHALEMALVEKDIQKKEIKKVEKLVENLKKYEQELRELRQARAYILHQTSSIKYVLTKPYRLENITHDM